MTPDTPRATLVAYQKIGERRQGARRRGKERGRRSEEGEGRRTGKGLRGLEAEPWGWAEPD